MQLEHSVVVSTERVADPPRSCESRVALSLDCSPRSESSGGVKNLAEIAGACAAVASRGCNSLPERSCCTGLVPVPPQSTQNFPAGTVAVGPAVTT